MKTKFSKRILSLFLAVMMVVTSIPMFALTASAADVSALQTAIRSYESKMNGTIYLNMKDAYDKYIKACEAYDAIVYGEDTTIDAAQVASNLSNATDAMTTFTAPSFNAKAYHTAAEATGAYKNVVYQKSDNTWWTDQYKFDDPFGIVLAEPGEIVVAYDGTDTYVPTIAQIKVYYKLNVKQRKIYYISLNTSSVDDVSFSLNQDWTFKQCAYNTWPDYSSDTVSISRSSSNTTLSDVNMGMPTTAYAWNDTSDRDGLAYNRLYITSSNTDTCYNIIDGKDIIFSSKGYLQWGISSNSSPVISSIAKEGTKTYVINYKPIKERLTTLGGYISGISVSNYKEGGLSSVLEVLDKCTADNVNPMVYIYDGDVANKVAECGGKIAAVAATAIPGAPTADANQDGYNSLRTALTNKVTSFENYTLDSKNQYENILNAAKAIMRDVYINGYTADNSTKAGTDATALNNKDNILNPTINTDALSQAISNKNSAVIFGSDGKQTHTYASWEIFKNSLASAQEYLNDMSGKGLYEVNPDDGTYATLSGDSKYDTVNKNTNNQGAITTKANEVNALALVALDTESYSSFDAAKTIVDSIDRAKYTSDALKIFDESINEAYIQAYSAATQAQADAYGSPITDGFMLRIKEGSVDELTKALLNAVNTLNTVNEDGTQPNVNKYSAVIYSGDITDTSTPVKTIPDVYYGETFEYSISEPVPEDSIVTWVVTVYANDADLNAALAGTGTPTPVNSQVISTYNGTTIERTANGSMCIQYFIEEGSKTDSTTYKVYNAYGNVIAVEYKTEALDKDYFKANYADPVLPFYTFKEWSVSAADNGVVKVKPVFVEIPTKTVTVDTNYATISFNKMSGGNAVVGATATITGNSENIYGWAVATGGKYQIVGYGKDYKFNVFADESYVPIIKTESGYQINGTNLIADMVAGFSNNSNGNLSDDAYLAAKLDAKAPFVYVQDKLVKYKDGETNKVKFYIRVTAGTEADNLAYGIVVDGKKIASTAKNEGGQFYMATKEDNYNNNITKIDAYASYTFQYTFTDSNNVTTVATIATADYAEVK